MSTKKKSHAKKKAPPVAAATAGSLRLFEISALVSYHAVILAESKEAALKEVETWENAWHDTGEFVDVSDVDVFDVRPMKAKLANWRDEAHDASPKAWKAIQRAENAKVVAPPPQDSDSK